MAQGRHPDRVGECPLSGVKRTSKFKSVIFEAFVTTKPNGTGLGLAICSTIIERHGGRLTASSDGKNGALFQIVLPVEATVADTGRLE